MKKKENNVVEFIDVLKKSGQFHNGTGQLKEIKSPEEFVKRFRDLLVSISETEHFIQTIKLLNIMNIGGAFVLTTGNENNRGLFISHVFNQIKYDEEEYTVSFVYTDGEEENINASELAIPIEKMESVHGYISNEDDGQGDFYCLNIYMQDGNINVVWNC